MADLLVIPESELGERAISDKGRNEERVGGKIERGDDLLIFKDFHLKLTNENETQIPSV